MDIQAFADTAGLVLVISLIRSRQYAMGIRQRGDRSDAGHPG